MSIDTPRPLSRRIAFGAALLLLVLLATEGISFAIGRIVLRDAPAAAGDAVDPPPDPRAGRERAGLGFQDPSMSLHPYLGYVFTPPQPGGNAPPLGISISEDGFLDDRPAIRTRADGRIVIGILGGSVAGQLGSFHLKHLREALGPLEGFRGKELDFVRLGMPGYHQPQQVIQVASILAQGGEFDVILNLDGFNELAVPASLNAPQGANPLFPMNWSMVALDAPEPRVRRALGAIAYLKEARGDAAARFRASPFSHTATGRLVFGLRDREMARTAARFAWELQQFAPDSIPYFVRGPERDHMPAEELVPRCVEVSRRSSLELQALCNANGIRYVHVLQPNQYLPGSKPLSAAERESAFEAESPYRAVVEQGYPLLQAAGRELRASGVEFHDLSRVFDETDDTLYVDNCCHFNGEGNRILCEAMAASIAAGR